MTCNFIVELDGVVPGDFFIVGANRCSMTCNFIVELDGVVPIQYFQKGYHSDHGIAFNKVSGLEIFLFNFILHILCIEILVH